MNRPERRGNRRRGKPAGTQWSPSTSRGIVFRVLQTARRTGQFLTDLVDREFEILTDSRSSRLHRGLIVEMTAGVTRRKRMLDHVLESAGGRNPAELEPDLRTLMRMGTYELLFLDGAAPHAAVNETVELARAMGRNRWTGILNGVLRSVTRLGVPTEAIGPSTRAYPGRGVYRKLEKDLFPDPQREPERYFAMAFSFPDSLSANWHQRWEVETVRQLGMNLNEVCGMHLRVNILKASRDQIIERFSTAEISVLDSSTSQAICLEAGHPSQLPGFSEGLFTIQNESAMQAALRLCPRPGSRVLDLCAAPGTKATHLAELMDNRGEILATDISRKKLERLAENCRRLGIGIVATQTVSASEPVLPRQDYEYILVDAPCSNTGVLGKRPEARWRYSDGHLKELQQIQTRLLETALRHGSPGARILYSTCSIETCENEEVIQSFLTANPGISLLEQELILPDGNRDGAFLALLQKS